ncbi:hypothetical protein EI555_000384 [Monodon monoceros]|uniref:G-protein coupled receptors family 1 profile domain-containing protein n=2 Tax=Monodon monoceros TaxID=40151 RepID=A0A4U1FPX0_MONMO|nr:hypothetical protein EI555_000384 [Monodon monoceros]
MTAAMWGFLLFSTLGVSSEPLLPKSRRAPSSTGPEKLYLVLLSSAPGFFLFGLRPCIIRFLVADVQNHTLSDACILLSCANSTANPALYFFIGGLQRQRLREPLKLVLQRALGEETEDGEGGKVPLTGKVERVDL